MIIFTCPVCAATSTHPQDVAHGYCGRCHAFTGQPLADGAHLVVRLRSERFGQHVHTRVFVGPDAGHLQLAGTLVLDVGQWQLFGAALAICARASLGQLVVESPDDRDVVAAEPADGDGDGDGEFIAHVLLTHEELSKLVVVMHAATPLDMRDPEFALLNSLTTAFAEALSSVRPLPRDPS